MCRCAGPASTVPFGSPPHGTRPFRHIASSALDKLNERRSRVNARYCLFLPHSSLRNTGSAALPGSAHVPIENGRVPLPPNRGNSYTRTAPQPLEPLATQAPTAAPVMLGNVADFSIESGPAEIDRYDRLRNINFEIELNHLSAHVAHS